MICHIIIIILRHHLKINTFVPLNCTKHRCFYNIWLLWKVCRHESVKAFLMLSVLNTGHLYALISKRKDKMWGFKIYLLSVVPQGNGLQDGKQLFCCFLLFRILILYNIILYFRLPYFHVSNNALFSTWYFSTLILYRRSLDTFYGLSIAANRQWLALLKIS